MEKVKEIALSYYSRKDVQQAIFDFCKNRETVPRYFEGFGKRPDALDFPSDIFNYVKSGATSFHCSEEIWTSPLELSRDGGRQHLDSLRAGWDFLIDIDSKYFDYSKIAAELLIKALEYHGVKNVGVKFSGSKGLHLIIPWKAFPQEVHGTAAKSMFPEWPRLVAGYLQEMIHDKLVERIFAISGMKDLEKLKGGSEEFFEVKCRICRSLASKQSTNKYVCKNCRAQMQSMRSTKPTLRCPSCSGDMIKLEEEILYVCDKCKTNSQKNPERFERKPTAKALIESVDLVLVSSRHLFRVPYSLHEKTALASIVIDKNSVKDFQPHMADPLKIHSFLPFTPDSEPEEARELLFQALDWEKKKQTSKKFEGKAVDLKGLKIDESMFPPSIKQILSGGMGDGKKRALFILISFLVSVGFSGEYILPKVEAWNKKNPVQLRDGYIYSQVNWALKNKTMPPNCDSHYYKDIGIDCSCGPSIKNPVNYTIREALRLRGRNYSPPSTKP